MGWSPSVDSKFDRPLFLCQLFAIGRYRNFLDLPVHFHIDDGIEILERKSSPSSDGGVGRSTGRTVGEIRNFVGEKIARKYTGIDF